MDSFLWYSNTNTISMLENANRIPDFTRLASEFYSSVEDSFPARCKPSFSCCPRIETQIPRASLRPLYLFLMVTSVTPAASATSF